MHVTMSSLGVDDPCIRPAPENYGYGYPPTWVLVVLAAAVLLLLALTWLTYYLCRRSQKAADMDYEEYRASQDAEPHFEYRALHEGINAEATPSSPSCCFKFSFFIVVLLILGLGFTAVFLFPVEPRYSVCDQRVDWYSLLKNLLVPAIKVKVNLLFSVWNPNRFSVRIKRADTVAYWKDNIIATGSVHDIDFPEGEVVDFLIETTFAPGAYVAAEMFAQYEIAGTLPLDVRLHLETTVFKWTRAVANLAANLTEAVDVLAPADFQYCRCNGTAK